MRPVEPGGRGGSVVQLRLRYSVRQQRQLALTELLMPKEKPQTKPKVGYVRAAPLKGEGRSAGSLQEK